MFKKCYKSHTTEFIVSYESEWAHNRWKLIVKINSD